MKKKIILAICMTLMLALSAVVLAACTTDNDAYKSSLLLHLTFDEGEGTTVNDASGKSGSETLQYVFNDPLFQSEPLAPGWRSTGAVGGSVLFDGYSNYVRYSDEKVRVKGDSFSVSAWVAPRYFEWDDPAAVGGDRENLTAIVSQYNKGSKQGFILGYHRHGAISFQVGTFDYFLEVWGGSARLQKYEWNHVAGVFDGKAGKLSLYLNGALIGEETFKEGLSISGPEDWLYIGRNSNGTSNATATCNMHSGLIDDVRLYQAVLPETYIKDTLFMSGTVNGQTKEITFEDIWLQNVLTEDYHKPQYHGGPYQHWMNEPHAPMYYNGKYHIFFQFNLYGPYFRNICWGHLVSDDMVNWTPLKEVITPTEHTVAPDGIWAGGVTYDNNGVPVLFFTAGNDSRKDVDGSSLRSNQNIGIARPKDITDPNLTEWEVHDSLVIKQASGQGTTGEFRDPHIWKEGNDCYMLLCTQSTAGSRGAALLYTAKDNDLTNWTYRGVFYDMPDQPGYLGRTWELPVALPITNAAGTIEKYLFMIAPAPADQADNDVFFWLGTFNKQTWKFVPDAPGSEPKLMDYGNNVFTGPSGFIDPVKNRAVVFSIMQDQRSPNHQARAGWAHTVGMAREVYLSDDGTDVKIRAIEEFASYHDKELLNLTNQTLTQANAALQGIGGDMVRIVAQLENNGATSFGMLVRKNPEGSQFSEYTDFFYSVNDGKVGVKTGRAGDQNIWGTFSGDLPLLAGNRLDIDMYLDRSLIEAYFNSQRAVSARVYPANRNSTGIELYAEGGSITVRSLKVYSMKSIYA